MGVYYLGVSELFKYVPALMQFSHKVSVMLLFYVICVYILLLGLSGVIRSSL